MMKRKNNKKRYIILMCERIEMEIETEGGEREREREKRD